jgi:hypothetical protein
MMSGDRRSHWSTTSGARASQLLMRLNRLRVATVISGTAMILYDTRRRLGRTPVMRSIGQEGAQLEGRIAEEKSGILIGS